jgi:hypothetical protein
MPLWSALKAAERTIGDGHRGAAREDALR